MMATLQRTSSGSLFEDDCMNSKISRSRGYFADDKPSCVFRTNSDFLSSSESLSDETVSETLSGMSSSSSAEDSAKSPRVCFNNTVSMRVVYCNSDEEEDDDEDFEQKEEEEEGEEETIEDSFIELKKADNSRPVIEPIQFDEKEEEIRKQLVGCITAGRRTRHNFAAMYGCGKSIGNDDDDDDDAMDDDDFDFDAPSRVIACTTVSWL